MAEHQDLHFKTWSNANAGGYYAINYELELPGIDGDFLLE